MIKARQNELSSAEEQLSLIKTALDNAARAFDAERESDLFAAHLAALVDHGSHLGLQDGHCPLCEAARSSAEFEAALSTSRKKLAGRDATLAQATLAVTEAENALHAKQAQIEILIAESDGLTRQRDDVLKRLKDITTSLCPVQFQGRPCKA